MVEIYIVVEKPKLDFEMGMFRTSLNSCKLEREKGRISWSLG